MRWLAVVSAYGWIVARDQPWPDASFVLVRDTLDELRAQLPPGLVLSERGEQDLDGRTRARRGGEGRELQWPAELSSPSSQSLLLLQQGFV